MPKNCPKCDALMERQEPESDTGITGCWFCTNEQCGHEIVEEEDEEYDFD
jgi:hypothetical protein